MEYSKFNDPMNYMRVTRELIDMGIPSTAIFAAKSDESINHVKASYCLTSIDELDKFLDDIDIVIIENIALSKYLNSLQIYEYVILRGFNITRVNLRKKINNLIRHRIIQENEIILRGAEHGIKYYELDHFGYIIARHQGVYFHMGNRYISFSKKQEENISPDTAVDVKRILAGNQIVLSLLISGVTMQRFGIMETMRSINQENGIYMLRTAANVRINSESVLAYEVVRDTPDSYEKIKDKIDRYYQLVNSKSYIESNFHDDRVYPQLIICGESYEHNIKVFEFLRENNLLREEDPILFTEDLLNINNSSVSIYMIKDNTREWYSLPTRNSSMYIDGKTA